MHQQTYRNNVPRVLAAAGAVATLPGKSVPAGDKALFFLSLTVLTAVIVGGFVWSIVRRR